VAKKQARQKKQGRQAIASNVERLTINGQEVWHVRSVKSGRFVSVTTKPSSKRSMAKASELYGRALQRLANR
jgi:hypothetical protein